MKIRTRVALLALVSLVATVPTAAASALAAGTPARSEEGPPVWAYPVNPPDFKPPPDDGTLRHVSGSTAAFTLSQLRDFKHGARAGIGSALMKPAVEKLTVEDMVSLAVYAASLTP